MKYTRTHTYNQYYPFQCIYMAEEFYRENIQCLYCEGVMMAWTTKHERF